MFQKHRLKYTALWLMTGWMLIAAIIYLSLANLGGMPVQVENADKYGHVAAYAAVMFWFTQIYDETRSRVFVALALLGMGIALEFAQAWTGYRTFERADMIADAAGIAIGWIVAPPRMRNLLDRVEQVV